MTKRKFTPPTKFPAEYVDGKGSKVVLLGKGQHEVFPFIGCDAGGRAASWTATGTCHPEGTSSYDLHDIPKRITTWHNVYVRGLVGRYDSREEADTWMGHHRLCVYRIECDEDGGNPEIFVEEV